MMVVALAFRIVALRLIVVVMVMLVLMLQCFHLCAQAIFLHGREDLCTVEFRPWGCDQAGFRVHALQEFCRLDNLLLSDGVCPAHHDEVGAGYLVIEELTEITCIHFGLARVNNRNL